VAWIELSRNIGRLGVQVESSGFLVSIGWGRDSISSVLAESGCAFFLEKIMKAAKDAFCCFAGFLRGVLRK
jgi:hypothetical protein